MIRLAEIDCKGEWNHIINVQIPLLTVSLHVEEQLVLRRQSLVPLDVVDELLVAKLAQSLEIDPIAERLPLEVEKVGRIRLLPRRVAPLGDLVFH